LLTLNETHKNLLRQTITMKLNLLLTKSVKRQGETPTDFAAGASGAIATANILLQDRKVVFYFKKPFDLIPKYISTTARRNAAPKNSIQQNLSVENNKIRRLKLPINTGVDKNSVFSVGGKIPPDFLSKNRLNRHQKSIENDKDCRLCENCAADFGKCDFAFSPEIPESIKWRCFLYDVRTYFEHLSFP